MRGEKDPVLIHWLERDADSDMGGQYTLHDDVDEVITAGTLICAITDRIQEFEDDSIRIPPETRCFVDGMLKDQLSDEHDPVETAQDDSRGFADRVKVWALQRADAFGKGRPQPKGVTAGCKSAGCIVHRGDKGKKRGSR